MVTRSIILILSNVAFLLITTTESLEAQTSYKLSNSKEVFMSLSGTTPLQDWKMSAHGIQGDAQMVLSDENQLLGIEALTFTLPVRNLKGDKQAMDEDAYHALKADRYKEIIFKLSSANVESKGENLYLIKALGSLTVAGVTRALTLTMHSKISHDGSISFTGSEALQMSDYQVERPSLLFGVIRAGDKMTLTYTLIFSK